MLHLHYKILCYIYVFQILNTDEEHANEEEQELEVLRKQGIVPLPKPPPGVGLLPTPGSGSPQDGSKKIPSLFEIKVQPTVDLAQKIALRYFCFLYVCELEGTVGTSKVVIILKHCKHVSITFNCVFLW